MRGVTGSFTLSIDRVAEELRNDLRRDGWSLSLFPESFARDDGETGAVVYDAVDRAVVTFVGSSEQAAKVCEAALALLPKKHADV